ncbi:MAG: 16S rRNA (uracil(1498)-N(3))-methyltransferase [Desulfobacterales bacterium]|nr:16S rRNA (uracil(1498)-N(3))-methyltransferase [Desulfobacterales bacterium]
MRHFFIDPADISGAKAVITGQEARHLTTVLRLGPGQRIHLFDGTGAVYVAEISHTGRGAVEATILKTEQEKQGHGPRLHLGQALVKAGKMDLIVEKATELGVAAIHPFVSRYCAIRPGAEQQQRRLERWRRITRAACKQCNRPLPPDCPAPVPLDQLLATAREYDLKIIFWEEEKSRSLTGLFPGAAKTGPLSLLALVGPEGGFSEQEVLQAIAAGFIPVGLGRRLLRAETASLAVVAILQYLLGNLEQQS